MYGGTLNAPGEMAEVGAPCAADGAGARAGAAAVVAAAGRIAGGMRLSRAIGSIFTARITSSLVTRPPLPLPGTLARSTPCSRASLRTAGEDGPASAGAAGAAAAATAG